MSPKIVFPYEFRNLLPNQDKSVKDGVYASLKGLIRVGPENNILPATFTEVAKNVYNFEPRNDDVWVVTYPRSGTTVTQELVWMVANDMDYEGAKMHLTERFPYLESEMYTVANQLPPQNIVTNLENTTSRRFIKSHLTYSLLHPNLLNNKQSKIIYVARNPKDVIVSYFHFHHFVPVNFTGDFETFFDYFLNDSVMYNPYWDHILQGWENRHRPNYLFLFYEDLKKDMEGTIRKVATFLDKNPKDEEIRKLTAHLDVKTFKKNPAVNMPVANGGEAFSQKGDFIRKGEVRDWEKYLSPEMNEKIDRLIREKFDPVGLKFDC